jgi:hypothetical protein
MVRKFVLAAAFWLLAPVCFAQISVPAEIAVHQPIVVQSEQQADAYIWRVSSPAARRTLDAGRVIHVWAPPGTYTLELTTIRLEIDWEALTSRLIYDEHVAVFTVAGSSPGPGPGPGPEPTPNPYRPAPEFQVSVAPVKAIRLEQPDSLKLSEMYATVASQARAGVYRSLGEVRADLVKRGTALSLRGKYRGLAVAVDQFLTTSLGLEHEVQAGRVGDALETLAWAVWEAGRAQQ